MEKSTVLTVGLDVHKATIAACWLVGAGGEEETREIPNDPKAIRRLFRRLGQLGRVEACYEAGPCGFEVQRQLESMGVSCKVIAPSLIPIRAGDRVKTDSRDARKLARLFRAGELTAIRVPMEQEEAARDLLRCREDLVQDTTRRRHRLLKFLLRHGRRWTEGRNWSAAHWGWLREQKFEVRELQRTFDEYLFQLDHNVDRLRILEGEVERLAQDDLWRERVKRLCCLRGIATVTAMTLLTEINDFRRFGSPRALMNFVGVTPSIHSSANKTHYGHITKTGNAHVRRVLVETAWNYRHKPQRSESVRKRAEGQPDWVRNLVQKAQRRLHERYGHLMSHGKKPQVAVVALARELLGFIWALLVRDQV